MNHKTINKTIKDKIDNLKVNDEVTYNWELYIVSEIDDLIELASTITKEKFICVDYGELFDEFFEDEMETRANS